MKTDATFSPDRVYRYTLIRDWRPDRSGEPVRFLSAQQVIDTPIEEIKATSLVHFICLNPSTATETVDDPTVRRCIGFARSWGYGGLVLTNLFAYRATNPKELARQRDPYGEDNDDAIMLAAETSAITVIAWGNHGTIAGRGDSVIAMLHDMDVRPYYFTKTLKDQPCHPLYQPSYLRPRLWPR